MLSWFEYFLFVAMLTVSTSIGIYFGCFGSKQNTTDEYLMGNKKMKILPNAISMTVSQFTAIAMLGIPSDTYVYGAGFWACCFSVFLYVIINNFIMLPVLFPLKLTTTYEYLEMRFDKKVKLFAVFLYVLYLMLLLPVVIQAACIAAASGINIIWIYLTVSAICIFYTTIGGLKTVVWTDFLQYLVILVCLFTVFGLGLKTTGFRDMWTINMKTDRLKVFDFNFSLTNRDSFWTIIIGYTFKLLTQISINQNEGQKLLALSTLKAAKWCTFWYGINVCLVLSFCVLIGLEIFGRYYSCNPLSNKQIERNDELVLYYLSDVGANIPGLKGLFLASLFSASLSTLSCTLNSIGAVIYTDFVCTFFRKFDGSEKSTTIKIIVLASGVVVTISVFLFDKIEGSIYSTVLTIAAITSGPSLGIFLLGMFFPRANKKGGLFGVIIGFILIACLAIPSKYLQSTGNFKYPEKFVFLDGCNLTNVTVNSWLLSHKNDTIFENVDITKKTTNDQIPYIFQMSFYYFSFFGALVTIFFGLLISYITEEEKVERKLITPMCQFLLSKENTREHIHYNNVPLVSQRHESSNKNILPMGDGQCYQL